MDQIRFFLKKENIRQHREYQQHKEIDGIINKAENGY